MYYIIDCIEYPFSQIARHIQRRVNLFTLHSGVLHCQNHNPEWLPWVLVISANLKEVIMKTYHDDLIAGHLKLFKTSTRPRTRYFWNAMYRTIPSYVATFRQFQRRKRPSQSPDGKLRPLTTLRQPFHLGWVDVLGPFPERPYGKKLLIIAIDHLTCKVRKNTDSGHRHGIWSCQFPAAEYHTSAWCSARLAQRWWSFSHVCHCRKAHQSLP